MNFNKVSEEVLVSAHKVAVAYAKMANEMGVPCDFLSVEMDLAAVNETCPLDFEAMLNANPFNLAHDVSGIGMNLNRKTGLLENCFLPRYAK